MTKRVFASEIEKKLVDLIGESAYSLSDSFKRELECCQLKESGVAKSVFDDIIKNSEIAQDGTYPLCQDTGIVVVFVELGQNIYVEGNLDKSIDDAVAKACEKYFFRRSVVLCPIERKNTLNNSPAVKHYELNNSDKLKISFLLKGAGSENVSKMKMFNPTVPIKEIEEFVVESVKQAGPNPCPPTVVGVGIGGTFEKAAVLSKKALLRDIGQRSINGLYSEMEERILNQINNLDIGPAGFGGKTTSFDVFIEHYPCHIASLPVAVNINCHSIRHGVLEV